ncbi:MAG: adenylate/guanylate cyclase domain-containing protein [bacterium]|nr:adenylate/guanylate cyclase domain-containing protein [bacterium]
MSQSQFEAKQGSALNNLPIVYKQMLALLVLAGCLILALYLFFLPNMAASRLEQVQALGRSQAVLVSQMTLNALYNRDQQELADELEQFRTEVLDKQDGFIQTSVILHPTGIYYASTRPEYVGQKAHSTLVEQLDSTPADSVFSLEITYQIDGQNRRVFQFLRAITVPKEGEQVRIGTVQVLIGYDEILADTANTLIFNGFWISALGMILIWAYHLPMASGLNRLTLALNQVSAGQYEQELETHHNDELGKLLQAFNRMALGLRQIQQQAVQNRLAKGQVPEKVKTDYSLRKADLTCLCARIPGVQDWIATESPENLSKLLNEYLAGFEQQVSESGGQVVKIVGDKVYTLFEGMNGINNALRASIKLAKAWKEQNHQRKVLGQKQLDYGIGLHSAAGIAGTLGNRKGAYTFIGDSASVAEFLCGCSGREEILVASSTLERASVHFQQQQVTDLKNRNLGELEEVFRLLDSPASPKEAHNAEQESNELHGGFDSLVPDMLEETLRSAPLDLELDDEPPLEDWATDDIEATGQSFWSDVTEQGQQKKPKTPKE